MWAQKGLSENDSHKEFIRSWGKSMKFTEWYEFVTMSSIHFGSQSAGSANEELHQLESNEWNSGVQ